MGRRMRREGAGKKEGLEERDRKKGGSRMR